MGKIEITCNGDKIDNLSSVWSVKAGKVHFSLYLEGDNLQTNIPPSIFMATKQPGISSRGIITESSIKSVERNVWEFSYNAYVSPQNSHSELTMVVFHPDAPTRNISITVVNEDAGYFLVSPPNITFAVLFEFIGILGSNMDVPIREGQRVPVVVRCRRTPLTDQVIPMDKWSYAEAPDTPYLIIEPRDELAMPNLSMPTIQLDRAVLIPLVYKGNGYYRAHNFSLAKLPRDSYRIGVHLRADHHHYFGYLEINILSPDEYESTQTEIKKLQQK